MNNENMQLTFDSFLRKKDSSYQKRITGMTITVYDNHASISSELFDELEKPVAVDYGFVKEFDMFYIKQDPEGSILSTKRSRNQFGCKDIKSGLMKYCPYDDKKYFLRMRNGIERGKYYVFFPENFELIEKQGR